MEERREEQWRERNGRSRCAEKVSNGGEEGREGKKGERKKGGREGGRIWMGGKYMREVGERREGGRIRRPERAREREREM